MKADYVRYKSQCADEEHKDAIISEAMGIYSKAYDIELHPSSPVRLSLIENFAVFYAEEMKNLPEAIRTIDKGITEAMDKVDDLEEDEMKEGNAILDRMRKSFKFWEKKLTDDGLKK